MKKEELKIFHLFDKHSYLVNKNPALTKILDTLESNYHEDDIQDFIDRVVSWYTVKYSDNFLDSFFNEDKNVDNTILDIMSFDTFMKGYGTFEEDLFSLSSNIILQKHLIVMAGWGLIYNKNSNPDYGYYRASKMLDDFNSYYCWNLSSNIYLPILEKDYSPLNEENIKYMEKLKKKKGHVKKKKRLFGR